MLTISGDKVISADGCVLFFTNHEKIIYVLLWRNDNTAIIFKPMVVHIEKTESHVSSPLVEKELSSLPASMAMSCSLLYSGGDEPNICRYPLVM